MAECELGRTYKDRVSGFKGVAVCRTEWLGGCIRIGLQTKVGEDGKVPDVKEFDEPQLSVVGGIKAIEWTAPKKKEPEHGPRPSPKRR